jgi:hypothetical protein
MAIDTENKRRVITGILPVPDGSIDTNDRRHVTGLYFFLDVVEAVGKAILRFSKVFVQRRFSVDKIFQRKR